MAQQSSGQLLDETVSHDKDLTSKLELEIQSLQATVNSFFPSRYSVEDCYAKYFVRLL